LAILDWDEAVTPEGKARLDLVRSLLTVRRREIAPLLAGARFGNCTQENGLLMANWQLAGGATLYLLANISDQPRPKADAPSGRVIWGGTLLAQLEPWSVFWSIG
jgi:maltooligosyltrehalose trehalohydrolase